MRLSNPNKPSLRHANVSALGGELLALENRGAGKSMRAEALRRAIAEANRLDAVKKEKKKNKGMREIKYDEMRARIKKVEVKPSIQYALNGVEIKEPEADNGRV